MSLNLYGEYTFDSAYYAKKLIAIGTQKPFYRLDLLPDYIDNRFAVRVYDGNNQIPISNKKGYYVIYKRNLLVDYEKAIYAGITKDSLSKRLWRFGIELCDMQELVRSSGDHPGGRKYRKMGGTRDNLYLKYVLLEEIPFEIPTKHIDSLDENLAHLLNTLCNTKRKF